MFSLFRKKTVNTPYLINEEEKKEKKAEFCFNENIAKQLLDSLRSEFGLDYRRQEHVTFRKLERFARSHKICRYEDLISSIRINSELKQELINLLTVGETYFYRDLPQISVMAKLISQKKLRHILSAPCSSGEEVYSLILYLHDQGRLNENLVVNGIDINTDAIEKAREACYSNRSLSHLPKPLVDKAFERNHACFRLQNEFRRNSQFTHCNVFDESFLQLGSYDLVISRNMLIYFSDNEKRKALKQIHKILKKEGYLFLGHADITFIPEGFEKIYDGNVAFFRKV